MHADHAGKHHRRLPYTTGSAVCLGGTGSTLFSRVSLREPQRVPPAWLRPRFRVPSKPTAQCHVWARTLTGREPPPPQRGGRSLRGRGGKLRPPPCARAQPAALAHWARRGGVRGVGILRRVGGARRKGGLLRSGRSIRRTRLLWRRRAGGKEVAPAPRWRRRGGVCCRV